LSVMQTQQPSEILTTRDIGILLCKETHRSVTSILETN
jgi:hypothetical protein